MFKMEKPVASRKFSFVFRLIFFVILVFGLTACNGKAQSGPTLEDGSNMDDKMGEIQFQPLPDVDYRAEGPFSNGPSAPPNMIQ